MSHDDYKQIKELFEVKFKALDSRMDDIIASFNNYKNTTKQYTDEQHKGQQGHLDNLCKRTRETENKVLELQPLKKFYDKIRDFSVGVFVLLGGAVITMASYIYHKIS